MIFVTKKKIIFSVLEVLFVAVVPAVLVILNYSSWGEEATHFKIAFTGVLLLFVVVFIVKKVILNAYIERARQTLTQHKADLKVETDAGKRENLVNAVRRGQMFEAVLTYIFPFLILAGLYVLAQALETAAVQLSGTVGLIAASMTVGFVFSLLSAREVK